jgi:hypothetical protein
MNQICCGVVAACFKPSNPAVVPSPDVYLDSIEATACDIVFCVPAFVEVGTVMQMLLLPVNISL